MTSQHLLAICIPTYGRTEEIIRNLKQMNFEDSRVIIVVSSNSVDKQLSDYCASRSDILYSENKENRGFIENFSRVLRAEVSRYSLVLSDEDYIDSENLAKLLTYLEPADPQNTQFFVPTDDYFSLSSMRKMIGVKSLSYFNVLLTNPFIPTYMSGFIFPSGKKLFLDEAFKVNTFNYYPHLVLRNRLLQAGVNVHIPSSVLIKRGLESEFRDEAVNYVGLEIGIERTNYFLSHYKEMSSHNWVLEFWVACLIFSQTIPGLSKGYLSLRTYRNGANRFIGVEHRSDADITTRLSYGVSNSVAFLSHIYRRLFIR